MSAIEDVLDKLDNVQEGWDDSNSVNFLLDTVLGKVGNHKKMMDKFDLNSRYECITMLVHDFGVSFQMADKIFKAYEKRTGIKGKG